MPREVSILQQLGRVKWEMWVENLLIKLSKGEIEIFPPDISTDVTRMKRIVDQIVVDDNENILTDEYGRILITSDENSPEPLVIKTKLSEFENDTHFITSAAVPTKLSEFENDNNFITLQDVPSESDPLFTAWLGTNNENITLLNQILTDDNNDILTDDEDNIILI